MKTKKLTVRERSYPNSLTFEGRVELIELKKNMYYLRENADKFFTEIEKMIPKRYLTKEQMRTWNEAKRVLKKYGALE